MVLKNKMELYIYKAEKNDGKAIIEYLNIVGGESDNLLFGQDDFGMTVEAEENYIEFMNLSKNSALYIGKIAGEIACVGNINAPKRARIAHQCDFAISVKKKFWGIGVGTSLMMEMINFAKETNKIEIIHLGVKADNIPAIKLYEKMGFETIGVYKNFFKINGNYSDEILMNLYL